jgi:predicted RNA binding protein YcfA (HicA-like mRNA interferase family)
VPPRFGEFRTVLTKNGFKCVRSNKHEVWALKDTDNVITKRVVVSHGNAEIRTRRLFAKMLKQAGKTEDHYYDSLHGSTSI